MASEVKTLLLPDGQTINYTVDRSGSRKNIYITVKNGRVILKLPARAELARGEAFLREKSGWVLKALTEKPSEALIPDAFVEGARFTLLGQEYTVCTQLAERYFFPRFEEGRLVVAWFTSYDSTDIDKASFVDAQARRALKELTEKVIRERFEKLTAEMGLWPEKVTVKKMTASWGRCSSSGNISINAKVIFYPPECVDYVIIHELAHLRHMDHSPAFWGLVERFCPDWKSIRALMR